jgi:predicted ArsR family transcriptional regulator
MTTRTNSADRVVLTDPRQLRALTHPLRLKLLGLLRREGPMTATAAGEELGESSGSMSFHLRQLAKYGLVEEAGGGTGRQKPWRATAQYTAIEPTPDDPELAVASEAFVRLVARRYAEHVDRWLDRAPHESKAWRRAAQFGDVFLYLTPQELATLGEQVEALLEPYHSRTKNPAERPRGSRLVTWIGLAFPGER